MFPSKKTTIALVSTIIAAAALGGLGVITSITTTVNAQVPGMTTSQENTTTSQQQSTPTTTEGTAASTSNTITMQKTGVSSPDPLPGHSAHQLVMALPPRSDGKVWVGTVTWTASKPVEVVVLHGYNSSVTADAAHGQPLTAPFGNGAVAISLIKTPSGTPVASGAMPFAGNALAFHTLSGDKFTVTYTVDATAKQASSSSP
jgi:cytoskeletal protein RodZ